MLSFALPASVPLPVPLLRCFAGITYAVRYVLRVAYMAFVARMRSRLPVCSLGAGCRMPAACLSALRGGAACRSFSLVLDAASQAAHQFGDFPAAEQEQYDQQDKYQLGRAEEQGEDE